MSDIVERLLAHNSCGCGCSSDTRWLIAEAASEIVQLRFQNAVLKAELELITPILNAKLDGE